jgi:AcrR family transcriptional regulator
MTQNPRISRSKKEIINALLRLMRLQSIEDITITRVVNEARLTRMTFYRHFGSLDEVLTTYMGQLLDEIKQSLDQLDDPTLADLLLFRFQVFQRHAVALSMGNRGNIDYLIERFRIKQIMTFSDLFKRDLHAFELNYHLGGIDAVTRVWIYDGMQQSPQAITASIMSLMDAKK